MGPATRYKPQCNTASIVKIRFLFFNYQDNSTPDSKIYVYDVELDKIESFDFMTGTNDLDEFGADSGPQTDLEQ